MAAEITEYIVIDFIDDLEEALAQARKHELSANLIKGLETLHGDLVEVVAALPRSCGVQRGGQCGDGDAHPLGPSGGAPRAEAHGRLLLVVGTSCIRALCRAPGRRTQQALRWPCGATVRGASLTSE